VIPLATSGSVVIGVVVVGSVLLLLFVLKE
jgi:hypothetical protein